MDKIKPQSGFVKKNEVLLRKDHQWLYFSSPHQVIIAKTLEGVLPALDEIEKKIALHGWYAAGFISYEAAPAFDSALRTRPVSDFPYLWFGLYSQPQIASALSTDDPKAVLNWQPGTSRESYIASIERIKDHIATGKTYQVNYTLRMKTDFSGSAWEFFLHLIRSQNNHAAYLDMGEHIVCSASPELFFQLDGKTITCRPMKGTAPRGRTTEEDREQAIWLMNSEKNRAENVMIVDMIRNDLGKIAEIGSVHVPRLFEVERYPTLWQLTSTVTARTNASLKEIFSALFPCASITGAPKVSTMKIIAGLEESPRKIYTGTIGYVSPDHQASFNVAIRTLLVDRGREVAEYGIGGGIVWDSSGADEYEEALLKAQILTRNVSPFSLLETMLWVPGEGFFLLEKHLARLLDSAAYFDVPVTKQKLVKYLDQVSSEFLEPRRVRLLVHPNGRLHSTATPFAETDNSESVLKACLAPTPIDNSDVFLFHKTTQREVYESARKGLEAFDDVLLYNARGELTEFTIGNLVVELEGKLLTPPISCGVLAGTFRAHLLESGQVHEQTITINDLAQCTKIFRVNSVRMWQPATILDGSASPMA